MRHNIGFFSAAGFTAIPSTKLDPDCVVPGLRFFGSYIVYRVRGGSRFKGFGLFFL